MATTDATQGCLWCQQPDLRTDSATIRLEAGHWIATTADGKALYVPHSGVCATCLAEVAGE